jgi:hypothetical protein
MKATLSHWMKGASGTSGQTVFRQVNGETIMSGKPKKRKTPYSAGELEVQERFLDARDYAKDVEHYPALLALYQEVADETGKSVYALARQDWFKPPRVSAIEPSEYNGQVGEVITFKVRDVICAKKAIVTLVDDQTGVVIEKGQAAQEIAGTTNWIYTATKAVPAGTTVSIRIEAYDYAGNTGEKAGIRQL